MTVEEFRVLSEAEREKMRGWHLASAVDGSADVFRMLTRAERERMDGYDLACAVRGSSEVFGLLTDDERWAYDVYHRPDRGFVEIHTDHTISYYGLDRRWHIRETELPAGVKKAYERAYGIVRYTLARPDRREKEER